MRLAAPVAVLAATAAAAISAAATAGGVLVEAHPLSRVAVDAVGWRAYAALSLLVLAAGYGPSPRCRFPTGASA